MDHRRDHEITERVIERYVRYPETLSAATREAVEEHLRRSPELARIAAFYHDFYRELDAASEDVSPKIEAFVDELFSRDVRAHMSKLENE